jgi:hypothetical protein
VVRDEEDLIRLETEKLGRERKRPDAASVVFTAVLVSLGQIAPAVLSPDNGSVRVSDVPYCCRGGMLNKPKDWPLLLSTTRVRFFISCDGREYGSTRPRYGIADEGDSRRGLI